MNEPRPQRAHLPRIPVWLPLEQPVICFVTACCAQRRAVFVAPAPVGVAVECLQRAGQRLGWEVLQVCVMPDHAEILANIHEKMRKL